MNRADTGPEDSSATLWQEIAPVLDESLARLGERDRHALLLRFFDQKNLADVGRALGLSEDGARRRVQRALEKLRGLLGQRGVAVPAVVLASALAANAAPSAPVTLLVSATAGSAAATVPLVTGTLALMAWSKTKIAIVTIGTLLLLNGGIVVTVLLLRPSSRPAASSPSSRVDDVLPNIGPGPGGIQKALPWWKEVSWGKVDGEHDPSAPPGQPGCYGLAWGVAGYIKTVLVFQTKQTLTFRTGGWYVQVCVPENVQFSLEDIGRIQADWLEKTYGSPGTMQVQVLK